ncbi:MAG: FecR domain-containing protein [Opitutaceae bacterium]|nr:FecR domain-containing protein [Opitutaceae bacterium]
MKPPPSPADERRPREPSATERAALAWVARLDRGLSASEEIEFERWVAADARHARLLQEFDGTWALLDRVRELPETRIETTESTTAPAGTAPLRGFNRSRWAVALTATAAALVLGVLSWLARSSSLSDRAPYSAVAGTEVGELRTIALPDGSHIRLNTASSVAVDYTPTSRTIRLNRGEAHFTVAKDPSRPFTVTAGSVAVRAVGTAFNVRVRSESIDVIVTAGRVRLNGDAPSLHPPTTPNPGGNFPATAPEVASDTQYTDLALSAGEAISLPQRGPETAKQAAPRSVSLSPVEIERVLAWREHRLEFVAEPLAAMVAEFNRYHRVKIIIADPALGAQRFGGNFRADDPAGFVRVLTANFNVIAEPGENEILLRSAR